MDRIALFWIEVRHGLRHFNLKHEPVRHAGVALLFLPILFAGFVCGAMGMFALLHEPFPFVVDVMRAYGTGPAFVLSALLSMGLVACSVAIQLWYLRILFP